MSRSLPIAVMLCAMTLAAQSWDSLRVLQSGDRIKVQTTDGPERSGVFRSVSAEALTMVHANREVAVERGKIRRVQVRSGARRARNAAIGAAIGLAVGIVTDKSLGQYLRNESGESTGTRALTYIAPIGLFGGLGAAFPAYRTIYKK